MSAIHDLIAQVSDPRLRERLSAEWATATQGKKFGLVFEDHLPELLPLYGVKPRSGDLVCRKLGPLKDVWQVRTLRDGMATCIKPQDGNHTSEANASASTPENFAVDELLVVRQFGEPIFPALVPINAVANGPADAPWHTLIEADNYHALQLLDYLYEGKVDCIYIDPPYNTGSRDWKYNNDYVDSNDGWRHSKWLAFMEKRLKLAKRLLKPDTGVLILIVTIDEHEVHHLRMLVLQTLPECAIQMVTVVINPKGVTQGRLSRVEEYIVYCFNPVARTKGGSDDLLNPVSASLTPRWKGLLRSGGEAQRKDRTDMFYPIWVDNKRSKIVEIGEPLPLPELPILGIKKNGLSVAWPVRSDGSLGRWGVGRQTLRELVSKGYVSVGRYDKKRKTFGVTYLSQQLQAQIESGELIVTDRSPISGIVNAVYAESASRKIKTVWHRTQHDAGAYGSDLLKAILGPSNSFSYPKSIYAVRDAISAVVLDRPDALIVDFFAGSGTTLNAVNLLNAADGGQRRCILVTNNEVSADEAATLGARGLQPGDAEWEAQGICYSVTWPRSKFTILGRRDDGTALPGDYLTGKKVEKEKARNFTQIGFVDPVTLDTPAKKKQVLALIDGLPQTLVKDPCPFIVSQDHKSSILFDTAASEDWLEALAEQDHINDFYIITPSKRLFDALKEQVIDLLGSLRVSEEEKRPMSAGFATNLAYFKLDFLDKERVALKRAFREILPLLWLKAGAIGARPELPAGAPEPVVFVPEGSNFAVLLDEARLTKLLQNLSGRSGLSHVFIVTDADESFKAMAAEVLDTLRQENPGLQVVQLYRDYLTNFMINKRQGGTTVAASGAQG